MAEIFIKKYWNEENVMFFIHFQEGKAVRQVEVTPTSKLLLTEECPMKGDSMLYDQLVDELELQESDFITQEEFDSIWEEK